METKVKKVLFYPSAYTMHTAYKSLLNNPPEDYQMIYDQDPKSPFEKFKKYKIIKGLYKSLVNFLKIDLSKRVLNNQKISSDIDLVFSMGVIYEGNLPWVLDILDNPYSLAGYNYNLFIKNKEEIEKKLLKPNCKAIICANESSIELLKKHFSNSFLKKVKLIRPAIIPPEAIKEVRLNKKFQILFMGSTTNPEDFYVKGGLETIRVFERLQKEYSDIKLIIRCAIPGELISQIKNNPKIELIENRLSELELHNLYRNSSILLCPSHVYMLMSWLESMSYGLPIVALDTYAAKDYIQNNVNGFLITPSKNIPYMEPSYPVNIRSSKFMEEIKNIDPEVINNLNNAVKLLLKNPEVSDKISKNNLSLIRKRFSIEERNSKLKKIFDEATRN